MSMIDFYGGEMLGGEMLGGSSWTDHVKKYREQHPNLSYKEALQKASATYKGKKPAKKGKKPAKKGKKPAKKAKKASVEAVIKALAKPKKTRSQPSKQKAIENAMYLRERLFPVANSKNKKTKITMEHLKKMGFNTKAMTKAEKVALSKHIADKLHGRGIGSDVGSVVDHIFGFGGMALGGYPLGGGVGQDVGSLVDNIFGFGVGQDVGSVVDDIFGFGVGQDVGSVVDDIFGFGRRPRHPRAHPMRHKRGGFNIADLAPLAMLAL